MTGMLHGAVWPAPRLGRALIELARAAGALPKHTEPALASASEGRSVLETDAWLCAVAESAGLRAQPVECRFGELAATLRRVAPALLQFSFDGEPCGVVVVRSNRRRLILLTPELERVSVPLARLELLLTHELEAAPRQRIERWLQGMKVPARRAARARAALIDLALEQRRIGGIWLLRSDPGLDFVRQLRRHGTLRRAALAVSLAVGQVALGVTGWAVLGQGVLSGQVETGRLSAWALTQLSGAVLQLSSQWLAGDAFRELGLLLKQRLMLGALRVNPDAIRQQGSGRLLAIVSESEVLETAGFGGVFAALLAIVSLLGAALVLVLGPNGVWHVALLVGWCALTARWARRYTRARLRWATGRLELARSFLENVMGQRTRVAQQPRARWHLREDHALRTQLGAATELDARLLDLTSLPARGWLVFGLVGLIPALFSGGPQLELAIAVGGLLQASAAFAVISSGAVSLASARVAWSLLRELFVAATPGTRGGDPALALRSEPAPPKHEPESTAAPADAAAVLLDARSLSYRYRPGSEPVLRECDLSVRAGERVLLAGASGGGKSTLAALLVGLRSAESGHILIGGLDRATLGPIAWRRRISSAPQFHENHLLSASLAFNLLMGRRWPASPADRKEAERLCAQLGLEDLLQRMPCGLDQIVGNTGWQLSHGEKSRVFLARALLQESDVLVLDESFGALDPATLSRCMAAVLERVPALIVIAHP